MKTTREALVSHPFCKGMPAAFLPLFSANARIQTFQEGARIFDKGGTAELFYLIVAGAIDLEAELVAGQGMVTLKTLYAGEALGWSWFFPPYIWSFSARARVTSEAIVLDGGRLCAAAEQEASFGFWLSKRMSAILMERLQATRRCLLEFGQRTQQPT